MWSKLSFISDLWTFFICVFTDVSYVPCQHYMAAGGAKVECKRSGFTTSECITLIKYACRHLTYTTVHYSYIATLDPVFNSFFFFNLYWNLVYKHFHIKTFPVTTPFIAPKFLIDLICCIDVISIMITTPTQFRTDSLSFITTFF